jgi:hypothetical protein
MPSIFYRIHLISIILPVSNVSAKARVDEYTLLTMSLTSLVHSLKLSTQRVPQATLPEGHCYQQTGPAP